MLIDGDHSKDGVLADLSIMAHMAPCGAHTLLMDDIADTTNVGVAVDQVRKSRFIDVTHHAVFAQNSDPDNPCMRWKDKVVHAQKGVRCAHRWGYRAARFTGPPLGARARYGGGRTRMYAAAALSRVTRDGARHTHTHSNPIASSARARRQRRQDAAAARTVGAP